MKIAECLEIQQKGADKIITCVKCSYAFCQAGDNYKRHSLRFNRGAYDLNLSYNKLDEPDFQVAYQEYYCPGCLALLAVDIWCPQLDDDEPLWDIEIKS